MSKTTLLPYINLRISTHKTDYHHFGYSLPQESSCEIAAIADTGCQSCQAGVAILEKLSLKPTDLLPAEMIISAADSKPIKILGALILRFEGVDRWGNNLETRQLTYITDSCNEILLCKRACQDLGIVSQNFPQIRDSNTKLRRNPKYLSTSRKILKFLRHFGNKDFDVSCDKDSLEDCDQHILGEGETVDYFKYNKSTKTWKKEPSSEKPNIDLQVSVGPKDFEKFGYSLEKKESSCTATVMADTGCSNCLAGDRILEKLNLEISDLIPVNKKISGANSQSLNILGAAILRFQGQDRFGNPVKTRQATYIIGNSDKFLLSEKACKDLGIISKKFPQVGQF